MATYIEGDLHISTPVTWQGGEYLIKGHLYIDEGGRLEAADCTIALDCFYSREFCVRFRGGTLITRNVRIGGRYKDGKVYHCNFEIDNGLWDSEDTSTPTGKPLHSPEKSPG